MQGRSKQLHRSCSTPVLGGMAAPRSTHGAASAPGQGLRLPQPPSPASPLAAAAAPSPEALAQDAGDAVVGPANITVVTTPGELQAASLAGAQDIEIRSHLDLRSLKLAKNPAITGNETENNPKRLALLYASPPLRSIRVRCNRVCVVFKDDQDDAAAIVGRDAGRRHTFCAELWQS